MSQPPVEDDFATAATDLNFIRNFVQVDLERLAAAMTARR